MERDLEPHHQSFVPDRCFAPLIYSAGLLRFTLVRHLQERVHLGDELCVSIELPFYNLNFEQPLINVLSHPTRCARVVRMA